MREPDLIAQLAAVFRRVPDQCVARTPELSVADGLAGQGFSRQLQLAQRALVLLDNDARCGVGRVACQSQFKAQPDRGGRSRPGLRSGQQEQDCGETGADALGGRRRDQDRSSWTMNSRSSPASSLHAAVSVRATNGSGRISAGTIELPCTSVLTLPAALDAFRSQTLAV